MLLKIPKQINEEDVPKVELNSIKCENNLTQLTAKFNKQLSEHPSDIDLWVKFVNHQVRFQLFIFIQFLKIIYVILIPNFYSFLNRKLYIH